MAFSKSGSAEDLGQDFTYLIFDRRKNISNPINNEAVISTVGTYDRFANISNARFSHGFLDAHYIIPLCTSRTTIMATMDVGHWGTYIHNKILHTKIQPRSKTTDNSLSNLLAQVFGVLAKVSATNLNCCNVCTLLPVSAKPNIPPVFPRSFAQFLQEFNLEQDE